MEIGWIKGFCYFGWYNNHIDYWELCLGKIFIAKK